MTDRKTLAGDFVSMQFGTVQEFGFLPNTKLKGWVRVNQNNKVVAAKPKQ